MPTQLLSTGHGSLMWFRKEGKEWEGIAVYCWLFRRRQWHPTPVLLPRKSHGRRSLVGCSPWDREESDTTEWLHFHFSLSCIGEGNGNPFHCFCLENPRDGGAWGAAIYGVAQSWTRLKQLSSSSSSSWLFTTAWLWSRCYCLSFIDEETEAPRRELP